MLDRIKRRLLDGFKDFVLNMETTGLWKRQQIIITGILEDPNYMFWIMKNIKSLPNILELNSEDIETVLKSQPQTAGVLARAIYSLALEKRDTFVNSLPKSSSLIRDELSYLNDVPHSEQEGAVFFLLKAIRKLQEEELIHGFGWRLPPMEIFYPKQYEDGPVKILFETGVLAAEGEILNNRRTGAWTHYYDSGKVLARGHYSQGMKDGSWEFFFGNGKPKSQGMYFNDNRSGVWKEWNRQDECVEMIFRDGVRIDD